MKKIFVLLVLIGLNLSAQDKPPGANPDEPIGTIVKPTPEQKASVKEPVNEPVKERESASEHQFGLHADLNIPHILNYGLDYRHSSRWFSTALNFGGYSVSDVAKSSDTPNGLDIKIANQELMLRVHPAKGSFYIGLGYGAHAITVETQQTITVTTPVPGSADVAITDAIKAQYLLPHVGWLWQLPAGLTFGMDFGYLSPIGPSVDLKTDISNISNPFITRGDIEATQEYKNARQELINKSEQFGKLGLPYWTVFRIGWLF